MQWVLLYTLSQYNNAWTKLHYLNKQWTKHNKTIEEEKQTHIFKLGFLISPS